MPSSDRRATSVICSILLALRRLSLLVRGRWRSMTILRGSCSRFQKGVECGIKADPSRHLSSQTFHKADEIVSAYRRSSPSPPWPHPHEWKLIEIGRAHV